MAWYEGDTASYAAADASAARREADRNSKEIERLQRVIVEICIRLQILEDSVKKKEEEKEPG